MGHVCHQMKAARWVVFGGRRAISKSAFDGRELNNKNYEGKALHVLLLCAKAAKLQWRGGQRIIEDKLRYIIKIAAICTDGR